MRSFFTPKDVAILVGISYRQIQYWDKTNFIKPSYRRKGKYRLYTFADLLQLKVAKGLRDHNYSIQRLRGTIRQIRSLLPSVKSPLDDITLLFKEDTVLAFGGEVLMNEEAGQHYLRFNFSRLRDDINRLYPETEQLQGTGTASVGGARFYNRPPIGENPALLISQGKKDTTLYHNTRYKNISDRL